VSSYEIAGSERDVLLHYLGRMRESLIRTSEGLTDDQQRTPGVPSGTNLLGLVKHLTAVEEHWFQRVFLGADLGADDKSMRVPGGVSRAELVAAYRAAGARSDEIVRATPDLSTLAARPNPGQEGLGSLRMIMAHMLRETARHCGHADILREQIDGHTNDRPM
jgi:uncharacterized damage-inducible protein DinB